MARREEKRGGIDGASVGPRHKVQLIAPRLIAAVLLVMGVLGQTAPASFVEQSASAATATFNAPVVSSPSAALSTNAPSYTVTGTAPAGALVRIYQDANANGALDVGDSVVGSQQLATSATGWVAIMLTPTRSL